MVILGHFLCICGVVLWILHVGVLGVAVAVVAWVNVSYRVWVYEGC